MTTTAIAPAKLPTGLVRYFDRHGIDAREARVTQTMKPGRGWRPVNGGGPLTDREVTRYREQGVTLVTVIAGGREVTMNIRPTDDREETYR